MSEKQMAQRCKADMVEGPAWEDYMWPHQIDKTAAEAEAEAPQAAPATISNVNIVKDGGVQMGNFVGGTVSGVTFNYKK